MEKEIAEAAEDAVCRRRKDYRMELRKLRPEEHGKTRKLWEEIFTEDTEAFLDYYYTVKTSDNEIFVIEDEERIVSMLQLNPYEVRVNQNIFVMHYIIAVATDEKYRKRGLMGRLLRRAMRIMYERNEPFTFLMPAAEAIYYPYDFRFVYNQPQCMLTGVCGEDEEMMFAEAEPEDCEDLAEFAAKMTERYQVAANRNAKYYQTLLSEQKSEEGGILTAKRQEKIAGICCYAKGEQFEVREPLFLGEEDLKHALWHLTKDEETPVKCTAWSSEKKVPMIMARILHLETFLKCFSLKEEVDFYMEVEDRLLEENQGIFHIVGDRERGVVKVQKCENQKTKAGTISIGELTSLLFAYPSKGNVVMEVELMENLQKFVPLSKVFLNEVV